MNYKFRTVLVGSWLIASQGSPCQTKSNVDEDLRHSEICSKAAVTFRNQPEWKDESANFTSHFNKKLNKCLVMVTSSNIVSGIVLEAHHVYDAFEGTVLGGKILRKEVELTNGEQKTLSILMTRDGKLLGKDNPDEAVKALAWFDTLMKE